MKAWAACDKYSVFWMLEFSGNYCPGLETGWTKLVFLYTIFFSYFLFQCDSQEIIGFYGAFFTENRISICTEFMDGK